MDHSHLRDTYDWVIIGGGVHGTHIAIRLLSMAKIQPISLRILDPNSSLLANWKRQTALTKMKSLRSPAVHHLAPDPFSLKKFAGKKSKNKRVKFTYPYARPVLSFFNKHCESLIKEYSLDNLHISELVESIHIENDAVSLETKSGDKLRSKKVVLALGQSDKLCIPGWAKEDTSSISHIFSTNFDWGLLKGAHTVAIVGGGITAIQTALYAQSIGLKVHLLARHSLRKHQFDSDPGWLGPKNMVKFAGERDYKERREWIRKSRNIGSIPPDLFQRVNSLIRTGKIHFHEAEVLNCERKKNNLHLELQNKLNIETDRVILATGFEKVRPGGKAVDHLIQRHNLPVSHCGFPLVNKSLKWHPRIHVSGSLAELEIGPIAKNISGARVAAERILHEFEKG